MLAALRRIPPPLVLALVALLVSAIYDAGRYAFQNLYELGAQMHTETATTTLFAGSWLAVGVLTAVGYGWLRHRVAESARPGVRIAFYAAIASLAAELYFTGRNIVEFVIQADQTTRTEWHIWKVQSVLLCAIAIALAMGLGFAVRRGPWNVVAIAAAVVAHPPWFLLQPIFENLGWRWRLAVGSLLGVPWYICQLVLLAKVTREPVVESPRPTNGFVHARRALMALGLSVGALTLILVSVYIPNSSAPPVEIRCAIVATTLLQLAALVAFALAALSIPRANTGVPVWLLVVSATAALCVAGRTVFRAGQLAESYFRQYFDPPHYGSVRLFGLLGSEPTFVSAVSAQLLIFCAIATFVVALAIGAKRRRLEELRARTMLLVVVFAALALASLSGQEVIAPTSDLSSLGSMILIGVGATFVASVLVAIVAIKRSADGLAGSATLPVARLR